MVIYLVSSTQIEHIGSGRKMAEIYRHAATRDSAAAGICTRDGHYAVAFKVTRSLNIEHIHYRIRPYAYSQLAVSTYIIYSRLAVE